MDMLKKRRLDENGISLTLNDNVSRLSPQDARKLIERFTTDQLLETLEQSILRHHDVLELVRSIADTDIAQRKLFIRGLAAETTSEGLGLLFTNYGQLEEAIVILDKVTGKSKGYGFVTFKHVDGALLALKEPSKKIDGRVTVTQLAAAGNSGNSSNVGNVSVVDVSMRKIYVANVPFDMPADRLLNLFLAYGDIEEGPLGFDKVTGKSRGFALFVYKSMEGAQNALREPVKVIDGKSLQCKLAIDGKKGKPLSGGGDVVQGPGGYGGGYGVYPGGQVAQQHQMNATQGSMGVSVAGGQGGGYVGPYGGHYSGYGVGPGYGAGSVNGGPGYGVGSVNGAGVGGGYGGPGGGSGAYRMPPSSMSGGGGYPESGHYGHLSASVYPGQHQAVGSSPLPRVGPMGGMYPNVPPNY